MNPAKPSSSMSYKTPLRELGLFVEGEDSEPEILPHEAPEIPVVTIEDSEDDSNEAHIMDSEEEEYMRRGNYKTPLHELGITLERLPPNFKANTQPQRKAQDPDTFFINQVLYIVSGGTRGELVFPSGSETENLQIGASQPNFNVPLESESANSQIDASQPRIIIPEESETKNLQIGASQPDIIKEEPETANLQIVASQADIIIKEEPETANLQIGASQPDIIIKEEPETANFQIDASQPNLNLQLDSETANLEIGASQPNIIIKEEPETANLEIGASQPNIIFKRESENVEETSAPDVEHTEGESDLKPILVNPVDITPEQSGKVLKLIVKEGTGDEFPCYGERVAIHYDGYLLIKGEKVFFESNRSEECSEFILGRGDVIKGWDLAILTMRKGETAQFIIDPEYAYGDIGYPPVIPPNTPLLFFIDLYDWKPEDLSPKKDCSILRRVLLKGEESTFPNEGSKVKIQLLGRYQGEIFEQSVKEFTLGEGCCANIPEGIEIALFKFHLKEKSMIYLKDKYGLVSGIAERAIPPRSPVSYEVTLLSFEKVKDVWEMNSDEKYEKAKVSKERGIEFTKMNNFKVALKHFKWIVTCLEKEPGVDPKTVEQRNHLLLSGYLNIALCLLKLENYKDAIKFCDKALKMQPCNEKALFRRGQAKLWNNDSEEAIKDFFTVFELYPENKATRRFIISCQDQIKNQEIKDKILYNKMFEKFMKQDQARLKNMKTETGVWENEDGEVAEHHYLSETERQIEQNNSLLRYADIIELSSNVSGKL